MPCKTENPRVRAQLTELSRAEFNEKRMKKQSYMKLSRGIWKAEVKTKKIENMCEVAHGVMDKETLKNLRLEGISQETY